MVKGVVEPKCLVSVVVKDKQTKGIVALEQYTSNETGNFFAEIPAYAGDFEIAVNDYFSGVKQTSAINIPETDFYREIVDKFNNASSTSEIKNLVLDRGGELGLDTKYFTDDMSEKISKRLYAKKGSYTIENIRKQFDKCVLYSYLYDDTDKENINSVIVYYDEYLNIASSANPKNIYKSYLGFSNKMKTAVLDFAFDSEASSFENIKKSFNDAVVKAAFKEFGKTELDTFICNNLDYVAFDKYNKLSVVKKGEILSEMKKAQNCNTAEDYVELYNKILNDKSSQAGSEGSGKGSGGGGAAGSIGPKSFDSEIVENTVPKIDTDANASSNAFEDINDAAWAKEAIAELYKRKIVNGKEPGRFYPNDFITRAEFSKIVVEAFGLKDELAQSDFADVDPKGWSYIYIASAVNAGIVSGYENNTFRGNELLTREDMATIFYRALVKTGTIGSIESITNPFVDFEGVSPYAQNSVLMLYNSGIVSGVGDARFDPKANTTRAQVCKMIYNNILRGGNAGV